MTPAPSTEGRRPPTVLAYAPPRPAGLSPFIVSVGPGYVVVRLAPPPVWLEAVRLAAFACTLGMIVLVMIVVRHVMAAWIGTGGRGGHAWVGDLVILLPAAVTLLAVALAVVKQFRELVRRIRFPAAGEGSIALRRVGAAVEVADAEQVTDVQVGFESTKVGLGGRNFLRVRTSDGRTIRLLRGHRFDAIEQLAADLRTALLGPPGGGDDDAAAAKTDPRRKWNPT